MIEDTQPTEYAGPESFPGTTEELVWSENEALFSTEGEGKPRMTDRYVGGCVVVSAPVGLST